MTLSGKGMSWCKLVVIRYTFEMAPVMLLMEHRLLQHMASFLGWYEHSPVNTRRSSSSTLEPGRLRLTLSGGVYSLGHGATLTRLASGLSDRANGQV